MVVREGGVCGVNLVLGGVRSCHGLSGVLCRERGRCARLDEVCLESRDDEEVEQLRERPAKRMKE